MGWRNKINTAGTRYGYRVTHVTLVIYLNAPLSYDTLLELHHPIMSNLGGHGGRLERERSRVFVLFKKGVNFSVKSYFAFVNKYLFKILSPV